MADEQISLSSLLFIVVISGFAIRYFFFSGSSSAQTAQRPPGRDAAGAARAREQAVETIQQMFPQVDRRTILWDLQRTGGSVQATTERMLAGRVETVRRSFLIFLVSFFFPVCRFISLSEKPPINSFLATDNLPAASGPQLA